MTMMMKMVMMMMMLKIVMTSDVFSLIGGGDEEAVQF